MAPVRTTTLMPWLQRSWGARRTVPPRAYGWCRTRWSGAPLAAQLQTTHGLEVSAWTVRRWLHALGWGWKRAKLVAQDNDPPRGERLARMRWHAECWHAPAVMVCAEARDLPLFPQVGAAWMPTGSQAEVLTPGKQANHARAGARTLATGTRLHGRGPRTTHGVCRALLTLRDRTSPERWVRRLSVVGENERMHTAKAVEPWFAPPPRLVLRWVPTSGPRAHPSERAFGDVHDTCTRHHKRQRLRDVVREVVWHLQAHGPWLYKLSPRYEEPEVTAAVERIAAEEQNQRAA
jgi:Winged helix-turn helix